MNLQNLQQKNGKIYVNMSLMVKTTQNMVKELKMI